MNLDKEVLTTIKNSDIFGPNSPFGKKDWLSFTNGNDMVKELQDNGMFWSEACKQHLKKNFDLDIDVFFLYIWFANAIETAKQIDHERYKLRVGQLIDELADKFGFTVAQCDSTDACQKYTPENKCFVCEKRRIDPEILRFVDKLLNI